MQYNIVQQDTRTYFTQKLAPDMKSQTLKKCDGSLTSSSEGSVSINTIEVLRMCLKEVLFLTVSWNSKFKIVSYFSLSLSLQEVTEWLDIKFHMQ